MTPAVKAWNSSIQTRVSKMSAVLAQMKSVKMTGAEDVVRELICKLRLEEVQRSLAVRRIRIIMIAICEASFTASLLFYSKELISANTIGY